MGKNKDGGQEMMPRAFVINLDRATDRREMMQRQLVELDLPFDFIAAVDGRALSKEELVGCYDARKAEREREGMTLPEIGCALSHLAVYRKIVAEKLPYALVLEDDAKLSKDVLLVLEKLAERINSNEPTVVLMNHVPFYLKRGKVSLTAGHSLVRSHGLCWRAHGYFITRAAAERLLNVLFPVWIVPDHWRRIQETGAVSVRAVVPYVVGLSEFANVGAIPERGEIPAGIGGRLSHKVWRHFHFGILFYMKRKVVRTLKEKWEKLSGNACEQLEDDAT